MRVGRWSVGRLPVHPPPVDRGPEGAKAGRVPMRAHLRRGPGPGWVLRSSGRPWWMGRARSRVGPGSGRHARSDRGRGRGRRVARPEGPEIAGRPGARDRIVEGPTRSRCRRRRGTPGSPARRRARGRGRRPAPSPGAFRRRCSRTDGARRGSPGGAARRGGRGSGGRPGGGGRPIGSEGRWRSEGGVHGRRRVDVALAARGWRATGCRGCPPARRGRRGARRRRGSSRPRGPSAGGRAPLGGPGARDAQTGGARLACGSGRGGRRRGRPGDGGTCRGAMCPSVRDRDGRRAPGRAARRVWVVGRVGPARVGRDHEGCRGATRRTSLVASINPVAAATLRCEVRRTSSSHGGVTTSGRGGLCDSVRTRRPSSKQRSEHPTSLSRARRTANRRRIAGRRSTAKLIA